MSESRNRMLARQYLKRLVREHRKGELKGRLHQAAKNKVLVEAQKLIALLKIAPRQEKPIPSSLYITIGSLRATAVDRKLSGLVRLRACRMLALVEGVESYINNQSQQDATELLIRKEMGITSEKLVGVTHYNRRQGMRNRALSDIRECLQADIAAGVITSLSDIKLRLPEQELVDAQAQALAQALAQQKAEEMRKQAAMAELLSKFKV